jgi:hypothetical protein
MMYARASFLALPCYAAQRPAMAGEAPALTGKMAVLPVNLFFV